MQTWIDAIAERAVRLWDEALGIWLAGGWAMIGIAVISLVMFGVGMHVHLRLRATGFRSVSESTWRRWLAHPRERRGPIGRMLDFVLGADTLEETAERFQRLRATESAPFTRDLRVMKTCVGAEPLVGLLGTVTGMLATFGALASGSGGDKTMALVAKGISEALITTETGLVVALPGLFFQYQLTRTHERYEAFLAHLETVCTQAMYRRQRETERQGARRAARREIARTVLQRLRAERALSHAR